MSPEARSLTANIGGGMATWTVSEPYLNSWVYDEPLGYAPGLGYRISFKLAYKQRESRAGTNTSLFSCGTNWNCSWLGYFIATPAYTTNSPELVLPGGGERLYTADGQTPEFYSNTKLTESSVGGVLTGYILSYPDGATDYYSNVFTDSSGALLALLSAKVDPAGHAIRFIYATSGSARLLTNVIDCDGRTNTLNYTNTSFPRQITSVTDPFNRTCNLYYGSSGILQQVTDVQGISSSFSYDTNIWVTSLTTPYGTTTFSYTNVAFGGEGINLSCMVVDPAKATFLALGGARASDVLFSRP
jgi:hypothetical protein